MRAIAKRAATQILRLRLALRHDPPEPAVRVLNFHAIPPDERESFRRIAECLLAETRVLSPTEFLEVLAGRATVGPRAAVLTFDDGLESQFLAARAVLDPLGIRGLFFIPTAFMNRSDTDADEFVATRIYPGALRRHAPAGYRPMTWAQVETLVKSGHSLGSHTRSHARLSELSANAAEDDVAAAKRELAARFGTAIEAFAYPFGDYRSISRTALQVIARHHTCSFSGLRGRVTSRTPALAIPRDEIEPRTPVEHVRLILRGLYDPLYAFRLSRLQAMASKAARVT